MKLYMRQPLTSAPAYVAGQLFAKDQAPLESTDIIKFIRGKFEETDSEQDGPAGRDRKVKGIITVPMLYRSYLAMAEYIDPYLDGSRFKKSGAIVDEGRIFITQMIESVYLKNTSEVNY